MPVAFVHATLRGPNQHSQILHTSDFLLILLEALVGGHWREPYEETSAFEQGKMIEMLLMNSISCGLKHQFSDRLGSCPLACEHLVAE